MRSSKFQHPTSIEILNTTHQAAITIRYWSSKFGPSLVLGSWCLVFLAVTPALGQYSIDWSKIAGGGGTSTGSVYSISGTIGQLDAGGTMTGGGYSLNGGFWSLISVVQTEGLPNLAISHAGNSVIVSWPNTAGFTLQQNTNPAAPAGWTTSAYSVNTSNGINVVTITQPTGKLFFRLSK